MKTDDKLNFDNMDAIGKIGEEKIFKPYFEEERKCVCTHVDDINIKDRAYYDYQCKCENGGTYLIEIKTDVLSLCYGNFLVECTQYGKPSGIEITKADIWAHITPTHMYLFSTKKLKKYCNKFEKFSYKSGKSWMQGYKLPIEDTIKALQPVIVEVSHKIRNELIDKWEDVNKKKLEIYYAG